MEIPQEKEKGKSKGNKPKLNLPIVPWKDVYTESFPGYLSEEKETILSVPQSLYKETEKVFSKDAKAQRLHVYDLLRQEDKKNLPHEVFLTAYFSIHLIHPKNKEEKNPLLDLMGRKKLLREMTPKQGFCLAAAAIRQNDTKAFKKIALTFKSRHPDHTDLALLQDTNGQRLGHMAAILDKKDIIQYLASANRTHLTLPDDQGNTLVHTASEWSSVESLEYLISHSKKLFGIPNLKGQTPLDLKSGPQICRAIALQIVQQDTLSAEKILRKSLEKCRSIQNYPPKELPPPEIPHPSIDLQFEQLSVKE